MGNSNLTHADANRPATTRDTRYGREVKASRTAAVIVTHDSRMTDYADRTVRIVDGRLTTNSAEATATH